MFVAIGSSTENATHKMRLDYLAFGLLFIRVSVVWAQDIITWSSSGENRQRNDPCTVNRTKENGRCQFVEDCPIVLDEMKKSTFPTLCGFENKREIICCPEQKIIEQKVSTGSTSTVNRISTQSMWFLFLFCDYKVFWILCVINAQTQRVDELSTFS